MPNQSPAAVNLDPISLSRLSKLHPKLRAEALALYGAASHALTGRAMLRIAQGLRTFAEQDALFKQRPPVTKASAGQSLHNYGLALDIVLIIDGKEASWDRLKDYDGDRVADWMEVVQIFKAAGWTWGGDWTSFKDYPHLEKPFGRTWQDLFAAHKARKVDADGYVRFI